MRRTVLRRKQRSAAAVAVAITILIAGVALAKGVDLSTDGTGHRFVTYLAFYGSAAVLILVAVMLMIIEKGQEAEAMTDDRSVHIKTFSQSGGITTFNQSGGVNANTINVNHETPPAVELTKDSENEPRGDSFVTTYFADLQGRPPMLGIAATGSRHIETIYAIKDRQSGMLEGVERGSLDGGGGAFMTWQNPAPARYRVEIVTSQPVSGMRVEAFDRWTA